MIKLEHNLIANFGTAQGITLESLLIDKLEEANINDVTLKVNYAVDRRLYEFTLASHANDALVVGIPFHGSELVNVTEDEFERKMSNLFNNLTELYNTKSAALSI